MTMEEQTSEYALVQTFGCYFQLALINTVDWTKLFGVECDWHWSVDEVLVMDEILTVLRYV